MRTKEYDLIVLGTGDAGQAVALAAAKEKWKVAIIEKKAIGGTCALWGCVPKKVLISGEELVNFSQRMAAAGLSSKTTPDWSELMAFKHRLTGSYSKDSRSSLQKHGIDIYAGTASFVGEAAIRVGEVVLQGGYIHIATGACPRPLGIPGEEFMTTSAEFLYLEELPQRCENLARHLIRAHFSMNRIRCDPAAPSVSNSSICPGWSDLCRAAVRQSAPIAAHIAAHPAIPGRSGTAAADRTLTSACGNATTLT